MTTLTEARLQALKVSALELAHGPGQVTLDTPPSGPGGGEGERQK